MALISGTRLGPYEIRSALGAGGMGEVYRALDTTLNREIAIKVLPESIAQDADRLARFEREAQVLASLNHPNIAQIHGLEERGGIRALVMELVPGEDLSQRIARGPIALEDALPIAKQIADALEASHDQGIVHRDLKPANIRIRPDHTVKVLDFGLAKATGQEGQSAAIRAQGSGSRDQGAGEATFALSVDVTRPRPAVTEAGVVLGTVPYMSPEQARGLSTDRRTDIWAFGCVLYEMLASRRAFGGETASDSIAVILTGAPDWNALPVTTPPTVRRLLARCLEKDLRKRLQHIGDARIEIEEVLSGRPDGPAATAGSPAHSSISMMRSIAAVASFAALILVGALGWNWWRPGMEQARPPRLSRLMIAESGAKALTVTPRSLAITPDGTRIVYIGNRQTQVFVRALDQLDATAIATGTAPVNWVCTSPDGQWVGFVDGVTLMKVAITGGPVAAIAESVTAATWTPDGALIVAGPDLATGLQRVSVEGGAPTGLTRPDTARGELDHLWPEILPGGRAVLFTIVAANGGLDAAQVAVLDLATGASKVIVRGGSHAFYVASNPNSSGGAGHEGGHLVFAAGGTLRAVGFDLASLETRGTTVTVLPRLLTSPQGSANVVVAADGTLAYVDRPATVAADTLVWVDRQGREEALTAPPRGYLQPRVSPDGTRVAVVIGEQQNDIWIWDLARQTLGQRTFGAANKFFPVWTPDGRRLIFASQGESPPMIFSLPADGATAAEPLGKAFPSGGLPSGLTPDGKLVLFQTNFGNRNLMTLDLETHRVQPLLEAPSNERNGVVSRDGHWLAYESDTSGRYEIYVRPFPDSSSGAQWLVSTDGGMRPIWAQGGQELFYESPSGALMAVRVDPRAGSWNAGSPTKLFAGPYLTGGGGLRNFDLSSDGKRFLMIKHAADSTTPVITVVQNWFTELNRLAPTK